MRRWRIQLHALFALLLFFQSTLAFAQCLRMAPQNAGVGIDYVFCSYDSSLPPLVPGHDGTQPATADHAGGFCFVCHALPNGVVPASPMLALPQTIVSHVDIAIAYAAPDDLAPASYASRAPPTLT
jgi:hypothetical protein